KFDGDPGGIAENFGTFIKEFVENDPECQPSTSNTYAGIDPAFIKSSVWPAPMISTVGPASASRVVAETQPWRKSYRRALIARARSAFDESSSSGSIASRDARGSPRYRSRGYVKRINSWRVRRAKASLN